MSSMSPHGLQELQPIPGYLYLSRPIPSPGTSLPGTSSSPSPLSFSDATPSLMPAYTPQAEVEASQRTRTQPVTPPEKNDIARLVFLWLEALDGRRSPNSLRSPRFHPDIPGTLSQVRGRLHLAGAPNERADVASMLRTVHIQKTATHKTRFCASVVIKGRVRAVAGSLLLVRVRKHRGSPPATVWRVETLQVI